jgi:hypothetical protein
MAKPNDIILLAGKWAEEVIVRNSGPEPWSDVQVVKRVAKEIQQNQIV